MRVVEGEANLEHIPRIEGRDRREQELHPVDGQILDRQRPFTARLPVNVVHVGAREVGRLSIPSAFVDHRGRHRAAGALQAESQWSGEVQGGHVHRLGPLTGRAAEDDRVLAGDEDLFLHADILPPTRPTAKRPPCMLG